jgi:hypothetical protein
MQSLHEPALVTSLLERIYELHLAGQYGRIVPLLAMLENIAEDYWLCNSERQFLDLIAARLQ